MSSVIPNTSEDSPIENYADYAESVTESLVIHLIEGQLSSLDLDIYINTLMDCPLVRVPALPYTNLAQITDLFLAHRQAVIDEITVKGSSFVDVNTRANAEITDLYVNAGPEIPNYIITTTIEDIDDGIKERSEIALGQLKRDFNRIQALQILTGSPISEEDLAYRELLEQVALPNIIQSLRLINFITRYGDPTVWNP